MREREEKNRGEVRGRVSYAERFLAWRGGVKKREKCPGKKGEWSRREKFVDVNGVCGEGGEV